jgi:hypothetical protein
MKPGQVFRCGKIFPLGMQVNQRNNQEQAGDKFFHKVLSDWL